MQISIMDLASKQKVPDSVLPPQYAAGGCYAIPQWINVREAMLLITVIVF